jgi:GT2 family glycosyltransferase
LKRLISFVIIAYNEAANIGRTLNSIVSLDGLERYEIIVVNDGSRDRTGQIVSDAANHNPNIRLIDLPRNYGRGYARSTGIAAAQGELIATVDADILLPRDWLVRTQASLVSHDAVGGTAVPDGDVAYVFQRTRLVPRIVGHTTAVTGSNALYRREVFDLVGFDPGLREGEDVALNHATAENGLSLVTVPGLLVEHIENKTFTESLRWLFVTGKGATRQLLIYRQVRTPDLATAAFLASVAAGVSVIAIGQPILGIALPIAFVLAVGSQHVHSRFETPLKQWRQAGSAIAVDSALLLAYFTGRVLGLGILRHGWPRATQQGGLPNVRQKAVK